MAQNGKHRLFGLASNYEFNFEWNIAGQDVENNTSTISWSVTVTDINGHGLGSDAGVTTYANDMLVFVGNYRYDKGDNYVDCAPYGTATITSGTTTLKHTGYEPLEVTASIDWTSFGRYFRSESYGWATNQGGINSHTVTFIVDYVKRAVSIKAVTPTNPTDEDNITITYYNPGGEYTTLLQAGLSLTTSDANMFAPYRDISKTDNTYSFVLTAEEKAILYKVLDKRETSTRMWVFLKGSVPNAEDPEIVDDTLDRKEILVTFVNYKPTLDVELYDTNNRALRVTGNNQTFVKGISEVYFDLGSQVHKGATLENEWIQNGDDLHNAHNGYLIEVKSPTFFAYAEDNRGYFAAEQIDIPEGRWIPYFPLTCKVNTPILTANGTTSVTITGKYFQGNFGAMANSMQMEYLMAEEGDDNPQWSTRRTITPSVDTQGNYSYSFTITNLNYTSRYNLKVRVIDEIMTDTVQASTIVSAQPLFDWSKNDFAFHIPVTIDGASVPSIVQQGTSGIWTYRLWSDGSAELWGYKEVNATIPNATSGWYSSGELSLTNITYPFTFVSLPTVITSVMPSGSTWAVLFPSNTTGSTSQTGTYQLMSTSKFDTSKKYYIAYQVKGKWR